MVFLVAQWPLHSWPPPGSSHLATSASRCKWSRKPSPSRCTFHQPETTLQLTLQENSNELFHKRRLGNLEKTMPNIGFQLDCYFNTNSYSVITFHWDSSKSQTQICRDPSSVWHCLLIEGQHWNCRAKPRQVPSHNTYVQEAFAQVRFAKQHTDSRANIR